MLFRSLAGTPGAARVWATPTTNGTPLLVVGQTATNGTPATFNAPYDEVWLEPLAPGRVTLAYAFEGTGTASNITCSYILPTTVARIWLEPITSETVLGGTAIINPAAVVTGELAAFEVIVYPMSIPDSSITWKVIQLGGNVTFYGNNNKGRKVYVRGSAVGDFALEVTIGTNSPPVTPKPIIYGTVKEMTVTPLHIFIVCDENGNPVVSVETVDAWIAEANRIYRQAAMSFYRASGTYIVNTPEWLHIEDTERLAQMCATTNNTGGLEVYCVASLYNGRRVGTHLRATGDLSDEWNGLAVTATAPLHTLAHEIGHACGLADIMEGMLGDTPTSEALAGADNWSGGWIGTMGYHPEGLSHRHILRRLLMYDTMLKENHDIPLGIVVGCTNETDTVTLPLPVGLKSMNRNPRH